MRILIFILLLTQTSIVFSFENLQKGVGITEEVDSAIRSTSLPYAIARQGQRSADNNELVEAFLDVGTTVYSLSSNTHLIQTNNLNRTLIGHWPLASYSNHLYLSGEYSSAYKEIASVHGEVADAPTDPSAIAGRGVTYLYSSRAKTINQYGCLQKSPLRYGDINGDNNNELLLFLGTDMLVFSSALNEVVFSGHYWLSDELTEEDATRHFPGERTETEPQYIAYGGTDVLVREIYPARRSLSKYYFGEFNNDGHHDIVIWRKVYESRLRSNPEPGFDKLAERQVHYSLIDGRYQLQETADDEIKQWLTINNLSWKKGYPSQSECEGKEGQLIPEMHDALLNDPDVLQ